MAYMLKNFSWSEALIILKILKMLMLLFCSAQNINWISFRSANFTESLQTASDIKIMFFSPKKEFSRLFWITYSKHIRHLQGCVIMYGVKLIKNWFFFLSENWFVCRWTAEFYKSLLSTSIESIEDRWCFFNQCQDQAKKCKNTWINLFIQFWNWVLSGDRNLLWETPKTNGIYLETSCGKF